MNRFLWYLNPRANLTLKLLSDKRAIAYTAFSMLARYIENKTFALTEANLVLLLYLTRLRNAVLYTSTWDYFLHDWGGEEGGFRYVVPENRYVVGQTRPYRIYYVR